MDTTTEEAEATVAPFEFEFDFSDEDHCAGTREMVREELPGDWANFLPDADSDTLWRAYKELIDGRYPGKKPGRINAAVREALVCARDRLHHCAVGGCYCANDDWDSEADYLKSMLDEIDGAWVLYRTRNGEDQFLGALQGTLTWEDFTKAANDRDGFGRITVTWNGRELNQTWGGYSCCGGDVYARLLTDAQNDTARYYQEVDTYYDSSDGTAAWIVYQYSDELGTVAKTLHASWCELADGEDVITLEETLAGLHAAKFDTLGASERACILSLATGWNGTADELVNTLRLVTAA